MRNSYQRGEIYYVQNGQRNGNGSVQQGGRPGIIVSNDMGNAVGPTLEMVYLTGKKKKSLPTHVRIMSAKLPSTALCEQIVTIDKCDIGKYVGRCSVPEMEEIDSALAVSLGIGTDAEIGGRMEKQGK